MPKTTHTLQILANTINDVTTAMFTTVGPNQELYSRPMIASARLMDRDLCFISLKNTGKVDAIKEHPRVNVTFVDNQERFFSIRGYAEIVDDPHFVGQVWEERFASWFPQGPNDPSLRVIRVRIDSAQFWDTPNAEVVHLIGE